MPPKKAGRPRSASRGRAATKAAASPKSPAKSAKKETPVVRKSKVKRIDSFKSQMCRLALNEPI